MVEPSPTGLGACHLHGDHWHCDEEGEEGHDHSHEGHDHSGHSHAGHSHAGHSHGPSEEFGCGLAPLEEYNLPLHVAAVFILLVASIAGVVLPSFGNLLERAFATTASQSATFRRWTGSFTFAMRHFGGGIILSTAFIHLLFHSFIYFNNSCIGELQYEAASAAIAMAAVYVMFLIDFLALRPLRRQAYAAQERAFASGARSTSDDDSVEKPNERALIPEESDGHAHESIDLLKHSEGRMAKWNVLALEAGIVFHSIIIGVTIGTASGEGWVPLLIAIVFHQFCEGLGLASRVVLLPSSVLSNTLKFVMHLVFIVTTPVGIAIGIGVRQSYNGNSRGTLLAVGILDAISAGILIYAALVQIIVNDYIFNREMTRASMKRCVAALTFFTLGLFVMSVLGYWA
ncbi:Zinc/iron permease [Ceraceosorus guamensis]|uniref:Zinc/iron permease n=1 Tax=Ceraceosorus guamensis TaxID=1522189 RepID=A0A316VSQ0_9BASI|nr:Zinc/iron permease [Ceraceosorus guamensis]PWN40512.1 Zinc/iron permease [Ceraceosorus guamensis]